MKFKKVEIQAFRAYQSVEDGTFDFEIEDAKEKDTADFVSIYAPNGFGKTSFYDAVEYGITNSIDRFLKSPQPKDIATNERKLYKNKRGQWILRNRYVEDESIASEVRLYTTQRSNPITRKVPSNRRSNSTDFHFDRSKIKNEYFQTVILSQEWIDAFLKVDDPKDRYEKFMSYFGDTETAEYYKKVVNLILQCEGKIKELKIKLRSKQLELNFEGDKEILKKVNEKIKELNDSGEKLKTIDEFYTIDESVSLANTLTERINVLNSEKVDKENVIQFLNEVFAGGDSIKSIEIYYDSRDQRTKLDKRNEELNAKLKKFRQKENLNAERANLNEKQQELFRKEEHLNELIKMFPFYEKVSTEIKENESEILIGNDRKIETDRKIKALQLKEAKTKTELNQAQTQLKSQREHLEKIENLQSKTTKDNVKYIKVVRDINELKKKIEIQFKEKQFVDLKTANYERSLEDLSINKYPSPYEEDFIDYKEALQDIERLQKSIKEKDDELKLLKLKIKEQQELAKDIEAFIAKGAEIADKSQSSTCPLCSQVYGSFYELSEKISNNKFLSKELSDLLKSRSEIETKVSKQRQLSKVKTDSLRKAIQKIISDKKESLASMHEEMDTSKNLLKTLEEDSKILQGEIDELKNLLNGLSFDEYRKNAVDNLRAFETKIKELNNALNKTQSDLKQLLSDDENIARKADVLRRTIEELKKDKNYKAIISFFNVEFPDQETTTEKLSEKIATISKELQSISTTKKEIYNKQKELDETLKDTTEELVQKELKEAELKLEELQKIIISFERKLETQFGFVVNEQDKQKLTDQLENIKDKELKIIESLKQKILNLNLLKELKKDVEPFLEYQEAKKEEAELLKEKRFLEKKVKPLLEQEKGKVSSYLDNQVRSFFYEDLINDLYKRIDPHPDYKTIKFVCDFKENKPKLNVCLYRNDSEDAPIIPNLYFSTAQLNILSLSIFLAKALNAKDDKESPINCIFIDDPIQSMDSINILSTIDLFRSIVVNQEKQIILSTHDENFHNLLKKKMPSGLFKSKFMELETFGKVKK
ncbi:AAA family ATPase [Draconibacterium mangrovi]|uniref:AAA family ATPase n=1 Tax=Draconibacterium mangrovi TaxID=2697469 RepID=UPI0013D0399B|nr:AAA family ATPase [Draconibacterium mangrovi]